MLQETPCSGARNVINSQKIPGKWGVGLGFRVLGVSDSRIKRAGRLLGQEGRKAQGGTQHQARLCKGRVSKGAKGGEE